jgi:hypothetical protein
MRAPLLVCDAYMPHHSFVIGKLHERGSRYAWFFNGTEMNTCQRLYPDRNMMEQIPDKNPELNCTRF